MPRLLMTALPLAFALAAASPALRAQTGPSPWTWSKSSMSRPAQTPSPPAASLWWRFLQRWWRARGILTSTSPAQTWAHRGAGARRRGKGRVFGSGLSALRHATHRAVRGGWAPSPSLPPCVLLFCSPCRTWPFIFGDCDLTCILFLQLAPSRRQACSFPMDAPAVECGTESAGACDMLMRRRLQHLLSLSPRQRAPSSAAAPSKPVSRCAAPSPDLPAATLTACLLAAALSSSRLCSSRRR